MTTVLTSVRVRSIPSADGDFYIAIDDEDRIVETGWHSLRAALPRPWRRDDRAAPELARRVARALEGDHVDFTDVDLPPSSPFFERCRRAVQSVPAGSTITYAELARRAGSPSASRSAGQAMRRNPTPIIVPCHRVVAAGGLGGFAGAWPAEGGASPETDLKARLLRRESGLLR